MVSVNYSIVQLPLHEVDVVHLLNPVVSQESGQTPMLTLYRAAADLDEIMGAMAHVAQEV